MRKLLILLISVSSLAYGQDKKPLDHSVYDEWKKIEGVRISNDGNWVVYEKNPQEGDGKLMVSSHDGTKIDSISRGTSIKISADSKWMLFKVKPQKDTIRKVRLAKQNQVKGYKKLKEPKDSVAIYFFGQDSILKWPKVKSYESNLDSNGVAVILIEQEKKKAEESDKKKKKKKKKSKSTKQSFGDKGNKMVLINPSINFVKEVENVQEVELNKEGDAILFTRLKDMKNTKLDSTFVYYFNFENNKERLLEKVGGSAKALTLDRQGNQVCYIVSKDTLERKIFDLRYWNNEIKELKVLIDSIDLRLTENWSVSSYTKPYFSQSGNSLYLQTAPKPKMYPTKDSLLKEEKPQLDIWSWTDKRLQPHQLKELDKDKKKNYLAVYHFNTNKFVQLADKEVDNVKVYLKGDGDKALGIARNPYQKKISWEWPQYKDYYIIDVLNGQREKILKKQQYQVSLSPNGTFIAYYSPKDSAWYSQSIKTKRKVKLSEDIPYSIMKEDDDHPMEANPYGLAGWAPNDNFVYIYDKYDVWMCSPYGTGKPFNITSGAGRISNTRFRIQRLDFEKEFIDPEELIYLSAFNDSTKKAGYASLNFKVRGFPEPLIFEDKSFQRLLKARYSDKVIWQKMDFQNYADLYASDLSFSNPTKISNANPQQKHYLWGSVELTSWEKENGEELEGLIYKPENFDPNKKYPMIVYFYEKYSNSIHRYYAPVPSASIVNFPYFTSNGYIIFVPDITYKVGHPGKSSVEAVVSGTKHMLDKGYIDQKRIGIQGQSWGGYQVAYIVTETDMFACGMAGAPVSNMTSAYGGIRWGSGWSRMFQYEESQSRIGGTLWDNLDLYLENSPVIHANKVNTPLLIMHNDNDGAVPWYQGIEYFVALRRLGKPAWLLNYNGDEHNLKKRPNKKDLSIRMGQFFDYYLKEAPIPRWMDEGLPATDKGKDYYYNYSK